MNKFRLAVVVTMFSVGCAFGQQDKNWVNGEVLVQLVPNTDVNNLIRKFNEIDLDNPKLVSKHVNIWKFSYDQSVAEIDEAIDLLYSDMGVITAQRNHILKHRATPNDAQYGQQWQYFQVNDRDIDADEAWDVTTGGAMATGEEIVVCVIDDGAQMNHPDLVDNLWTNANEIPGNNIDDDGNGYIDDVDGWNTYDDNDDVAHSFWETHGSPVAGIVGAKGNNGTGVAGVNWDVKLMIVKGGGDEADAIAAYSYALENRKLFNETDGQMGAFVVATNASWGVDYGQASQAPLWCAMYDTLGNHGVLSAGACPNINLNVDTQGDLPTQCPSDYLIAVTNTNQSDVKVNSAGYGINSIDLGAPGEGAHTVSVGSGYSGFGGTSGATPHVTGTIALLYSVPCLNFANLAKSHPKIAAEQVRDFILNGVDPNSSLDGITATGGRLNVNNAVQNLVNECTTLNLGEAEFGAADLVLYPNPMTGDDLNVILNLSNEENIQIQVYDLAGKQILSQKMIVPQGESTIQVSLPEIASGMYKVTFSSNAWTANKYFVK